MTAISQISPQVESKLHCKSKQSQNNFCVFNEKVGNFLYFGMIFAEREREREREILI